MPFNFFKRSKRASNIEPNKVANYAGMPTSSQRIRAQAYGSVGESNRSGIFGKNYAPESVSTNSKAAQYNPPTNPEYKETAQYNPPAYPKYQDSPVAADDPYAFLSDFDTVFLIDDSGSMFGERWGQTRTALEAIVPICTAHDADGIDIYFLNTEDSSKFLNVTSLAAVKEIFGKVSPGGLTPTGKRLGDIIRPYLKTLEGAGATESKPKPLNIIVITDGCPSDGKELESVIVKAATKLDALEAPGWQIGVQFFQVGGDHNAAQSLMILDDKLKDNYKIRDMVDTVPWKAKSGFDGAFILKVVTGAVNRRLDRRVV